MTQVSEVAEVTDIKRLMTVMLTSYPLSADMSFKEMCVLLVYRY